MAVEKSFIQLKSSFEGNDFCIFRYVSCLRNDMYMYKTLMLQILFFSNKKQKLSWRIVE